MGSYSILLKSLLFSLESVWVPCSVSASQGSPELPEDLQVTFLSNGHHIPILVLKKEWANDPCLDMADHAMNFLSVVAFVGPHWEASRPRIYSFES